MNTEQPTPPAVVLSTALLGDMDAGLQITNGPQSMCKLRDGRYQVFCDSPGCCDCEMTKAEAAVFLDDDDGWEAVPNVKFTGRSSGGTTS
jgi:hypothetical protein